MQNRSEKVTQELSPESRLFMSGYGVLEAAERRFWDEYRNILEAVACELREKGYLASVSGGGADLHGLLQVSLPGWPVPMSNAVHFEINLDQGWLRRSQMAVGLDVEDGVQGTQDKQAVISCLERILRPYEQAGQLLCASGCTLIPKSKWRVIERFAPIADLSVPSLVDVVTRLCNVSSVVDEAIFIGNGRPLWRTDFLSSDPRPKLSFSGKKGGQKFGHGCGRMGTDCVMIDGTVEGNHDKADDYPTHIMAIEHTKAVENGQEVYFSCVLRTEKPARLWFFGDGSYETPDRKKEWPPLFEPPHWLEVSVPGRPDWQHVGLRVRVRNPEDYSFSKQGVHLYLRTQTDDHNLLITSIEVGWIQEG